MKKDEFFMAIGLFLTLLFAIFGFGLSMYGLCVAGEIWLRLLCWFGSVVCLMGGVLVIFVIRIILS